jgi:hypothetical protein
VAHAGVVASSGGASAPLPVAVANAQLVVSLTVCVRLGPSCPGPRPSRGKRGASHRAGKRGSPQLRSVASPFSCGASTTAGGEGTATSHRGGGNATGEDVVLSFQVWVLHCRCHHGWLGQVCVCGGGGGLLGWNVGAVVAPLHASLSGYSPLTPPPVFPTRLHRVHFLCSCAGVWFTWKGVHTFHKRWQDLDVGTCSLTFRNTSCVSCSATRSECCCFLHSHMCPRPWLLSCSFTQRFSHTVQAFQTRVTCTGWRYGCLCPFLWMCVDVHVYGGTELSLLRTMVRFVWLCACGLC